MNRKFRAWKIKEKELLPAHEIGAIDFKMESIWKKNLNNSKRINRRLDKK